MAEESNKENFAKIKQLQNEIAKLQYAIVTLKEYIIAERKMAQNDYQAAKAKLQKLGIETFSELLDDP